MDRTYIMGKSVMANHARAVIGSLTGATALALIAVFVAPFYGGLERRVTVVDGNKAQLENSSSATRGIVVEQFDYDEPSSSQEDAAISEVQGAQIEHQTMPDTGTELQKTDIETTKTEQHEATPNSSDTVPVESSQADGSMQLLQRPVAVAAGQLESQGQIINLHGIEPLPVNQMCDTSIGESWPCGMQARTAFRQWLRSRAILCRLPQDNSASEITTECKLGDTDLAQWLIDNGWAKAAIGSAYMQAGKKAEDARLGIFGDKPDTSLPEWNAPALAPSGSLNPEQNMPVEPTRPQQLDGFFPPAPQEN